MRCRPVAAGPRDSEFGHYADPGYLPDGAPRMPLTSRAAVQAARDWLDGPAGDRYSAAQRKRMRGRIRQALADLGG
jgi:hypothetical protein